jgi:GntR family transcriptional regulator
LKLDGDKPIFIQLAEGLKDSILSGAYKEETQIPSTTEISVVYKINPATALKGVTILVADEIVYKKRGLGMFVANGAVEKIREKRRETYYESFVLPLIAEARKLGLTKDDLIKMLERGVADEQN